MAADSINVYPSGIYINPSASTHITIAKHHHPSPSHSQTTITRFHRSLPGYAPTPLLSLAPLAHELGLRTLLLKDEASRLGLPAFKILGASWGVYCALCEWVGIGDVGMGMGMGLEGLRVELEARGRDGNGGERVVLFAATDGNHGRAVARMAGLLGLGTDCDGGGCGCVIYVPRGMYDATRRLIEAEGARVVVVDGDYDAAVAECWRASQRVGDDSGGTVVGIMVQDNAFEGYEVVPRWIVEGYSTLLAEVEEQFEGMMVGADGSGVAGEEITHVVTPIGVGSLGHAVVKWAKRAGRERGVRVIAVEPETAGCLHESLQAGKSRTVETIDTIMSGMCCGTVSPTSWPDLRDGVDCSVTVDDWTCHETVLELEQLGVEAGPCGAGCLAGLRKVLGEKEAKDLLGLDRDSVVVVLSTEGKREYPVPQKTN